MFLSVGEEASLGVLILDCLWLCRFFMERGLVTIFYLYEWTNRSDLISSLEFMEGPSSLPLNELLSMVRLDLIFRDIGFLTVKKLDWLDEENPFVLAPLPDIIIEPIELICYLSF